MSKKLANSLYYLVVLAIAILAIFLVRLIKLYDICCTFLNIVLPIFFGYLIAWLLNPIYKKLNKKIDKRLSFLILIVLVIAAYLALVMIILPIIVKEVTNIISVFEDFIPRIKKIPYLSGIDEYLKIDTSVLLSSCNNIISLVVSFVLAHMFGFYILYNYNSVNGFVRKLIPSKYKEMTLKFVKKVSANMYLYIKGTLLDMLFLFLLSALLFKIFGLKYAILLAAFCAITNVIPFVGPYIGGIPAVIVGLTTSLKLGIITLILIIIAQNIESNIVNPLIMSKVTKINPLVIIIAITVMGKFFGIIGMAFAVPLLIVLKILIEFAKKYNLIKLP